MLARFVTSITTLLAKRQDLFFITFIIVFVMMFIIPVPPFVIDILVALNMALTLILLISTTYLRGALDLSTFPSIILFTTIFRLAISIASTRLILSTGDAGEVIKTFGNFIVGGNLIIGLVIFLIVAVVMFIVVVKGAERIAEVSARFTLDALPGKQMSIDSDARNGDITKEDARKKRQMLEKESQFFGAMDGAMRFVKGDAIAGFVIILVNLIGGALVGMLAEGMSFGDALNLYGLLTVGDGLVSQIPAMFVAIAAGVIVTRVATEESTNLGGDILRELGNDTRALWIGALCILMLGFLPGFPTIIFIVISSFIASMAWLLSHQRSRAAALAAGEMPAQVNPMRVLRRKDGDEDESPIMPPLRTANMGDTFIVETSQETLDIWRELGLADIMKAKREALMREFGFTLPHVGFQLGTGLEGGAYRYLVDDVPVYNNVWDPETVIVTQLTPETKAMENDEVRETTTLFGTRLKLSKAQGEQLKENGVSVIEPSYRISEETGQLMRRNASKIFGLPEATEWLANQEKNHNELVGEVKGAVPMLRFVDAVRRLIDEGVWLAQPRPLLETMLAENEANKDIAQFVEAVRKGLSRQIVWRHVGDNQALNVLLLEPTVEAFIMDLVNAAPADITNSAPSDQLSGRTFAHKIRDITIEAEREAGHVVIVTSQRVRFLVRSILTRHGVSVPIIAYQEIGPDVQVRPVRSLKPTDVGIPAGAMPSQGSPGQMPGGQPGQPTAPPRPGAPRPQRRAPAPGGR